MWWSEQEEELQLGSTRDWHGFHGDESRLLWFMVAAVWFDWRRQVCDDRSCGRDHSGGRELGGEVGFDLGSVICGICRCCELSAGEAMVGGDC